MKYQAFLWDFDGTLFDSHPHMIAALQKTLTEHGVACDEETLLRLLREGWPALFSYYGVTEAMKTTFLRYNQSMTAAPAVVPFDGAAEVLCAIVAAGGRNFLCTHLDRQAWTYLRLYGLDRYFTGGADGSMHFPAKPALDAAAYICSAYGIDTADAVLIGDRETDMQAAVAAGMDGCLISQDAARIRDSVAKHHAADMYALADALDIPLPEAALPERQKQLFAQLRAQCTAAAEALISDAGLTAGQRVIVGCSTSEVVGGHIGKDSAPKAAEAIFAALSDVFTPRGIHIAAQCCEHLNRAVIIDRAAWQGEEIVNAVPMPKAGGAFATAAYRSFAEPVAIASIAADGGLDIGGTMIGMHLKRVAVPLRLEIKKIGEASLAAARVRAPFVGGERAIYDEGML